MFISFQKLKSLLISISAIMIIMTGITPCFGVYHYEDLMEKPELTVYEQYLKDYLESVEKIYTPEKNFPQKEMELVAWVDFKILPDGSIVDFRVTKTSENYSHGDPFWLLRFIYYARQSRLAKKHGQYVKELLVSNKAKPFPEQFGEYIHVSIEISHWNAWLRKRVFETKFRCRYYDDNVRYDPIYNVELQPNMHALIWRSNRNSGR